MKITFEINEMPGLIVAMTKTKQLLSVVVDITGKGDYIPKYMSDKLSIKKNTGRPENIFYKN